MIDGLWHPLEAWPRRGRGPLLAALAAFTLALALVLALVDRQLRMPEARQGIVSFEVAGSGRADRIVSAWERDGALDAAGFSLGLDFLYLAAYSTALAGACAGLAIGSRRPGPRLGGLGGRGARRRRERRARARAR